MVRVQLSDEALKVCDMNLETNHAFQPRNVRTLGSWAHVKTRPCIPHPPKKWAYTLSLKQRRNPALTRFLAVAPL